MGSRAVQFGKRGSEPDGSHSGTAMGFGTLLSGDGWREAARLTLHTVLPGTEANRVAFDPMTNHPPGLRMSPRWLSRMRERAYQGSRAGRASSGATG